MLGYNKVLGRWSCLLVARLLSKAMRNRANFIVLALVDDAVGSPVTDRGTHRLTGRLGLKKKKKSRVPVFLTYI